MHFYQQYFFIIGTNANVNACPCPFPIIEREAALEKQHEKDLRQVIVRLNISERKCKETKEALRHTKEKVLCSKEEAEQKILKISRDIDDESKFPLKSHKKFCETTFVD